jgi:hypothetical protein
VGKENLLTRESIEKFMKKYPMFLLGVADSTQAEMCDTEPLLADMQQHFESGKFSYPVKKNGKTDYKPMTVARIDGSDKKTLEKLRAIGIEFGILP